MSCEAHSQEELVRLLHDASQRRADAERSRDLAIRALADSNTYLDIWRGRARVAAAGKRKKAK